MSNANLFAAVNHLASVLDGADSPIWGNFTCTEIDAFADLMMEAGREDVAASLVFQHAHVDSWIEGDQHAEIGEAARAQADMTGIEWTARTGYRLAVAYVREF